MAFYILLAVHPCHFVSDSRSKGNDGYSKDRDGYRPVRRDSQF